MHIWVSVDLGEGVGYPLLGLGLPKNGQYGPDARMVASRVVYWSYVTTAPPPQAASGTLNQ